MKLDVNDDNFDWELGNRATVWLDGFKQDRCTVADEEAGYIVRYPIDQKKRLNGEMEIVYGAVKIEIEPPK